MITYSNSLCIAKISFFPGNRKRFWTKKKHNKYINIEKKTYLNDETRLKYGEDVKYILISNIISMVSYLHRELD